MLSVAIAQYNYASSLIEEFNSAQSQLTQAANTFLMQMRSYLGRNSVITSFLSSLQNQLKSTIPQIISTYSPSNIMNFIMNAYQNFLTKLSTPTAERNALNTLYFSKLVNPKAQECWTSFQEASNQIYTAAGENFTLYVESQSNGVQTQINAVKNQIKQQIQTIVGLFVNALQNQNPANAISILSQYVSQVNFLIKYTFHLKFFN